MNYNQHMSRMVHCRHFNGYKPCNKFVNCNESCPHYSPIQQRILIVHLEALGAVLRSTSLLPAIKRKFPHSHTTWVTQAPAHHLLNNIPSLDRVLTTQADDLLELRALRFDFAFCIDKSLKASGVLANIKFNQLKGFIANENGAIVPANAEAEELWEVGLNDPLKFYINKKTENQLLHESLALGSYKRDPYQVFLTFEEKAEALRRKTHWSGKGKFLVGINTGCSPTIPYKKLSIEGHRDLISRLLQLQNIEVVLLGGPEDTERNQQIASGLQVKLSSTDKGLRDGMISVEACDIVISGDSLGMHMAIGLEKYVIAWFGPTCAQEIELYGRGEKVLSAAKCSPCWRRYCHKPMMCYHLVDFDHIINAVQRGIHWQISLSKLPFSEISFSPSPL